jgi:hypothetical protein
MESNIETQFGSQAFKNIFPKIQSELCITI